MKDINSTIATGRLTKDAEVKEGQNGGYWYSFAIAINNRGKVNGEYSDKAIFRDCKYYCKNANFGRLLTKGSKVVVEAEMNTDEWQGQDGTRKKKDYLRVVELQLLNKATTDKPETPPVDDDFDFSDSPQF